MSKAIVLLSGGLDSSVSLAILKEKYQEILTLTFDYSQKSLKNEIKASNDIANYYNLKNQVVKLHWLGEISNSLLNKGDSVPSISENALFDLKTAQKTSSAVWVPNRNALFINIAACFAESLEFDDIIIGANKEEGATFIDNSVDFINAINQSLKYSVNTKIKVIAPLIDMDKNEIVKKGIELNIPFNLIYSCYNGGDMHCEECESCLRLKTALKNCKRPDIIDSIFRRRI